jgi:hypothetical protein
VVPLEPAGGHGPLPAGGRRIADRSSARSTSATSRPIGTALATAFLAAVVLWLTFHPTGAPRPVIRLLVLDDDARTLSLDAPAEVGPQPGADEVWVRHVIRLWPGFTIREVTIVRFELRRNERSFGGAAVAPWVQPAADRLELELGDPLGVDRFLDATRPPRVRIAPTLAQTVLVIALATAGILAVRRAVRRVVRRSA